LDIEGELMRREDVERVLVDAGFGPVHIGNSMVSKVVDDLLALTPQPSREELVKFLQGFGWCPVDHEVDNLMAWAGVTKMWCSHLPFQDDGYQRISEFPPDERDTFVPENWTCCPICGAKRP